MAVDIDVWHVALGLPHNSSLTKEQAVQQIVDDGKRRDEELKMLEQKYATALTEIELLKKK